MAFYFLFTVVFKRGYKIWHAHLLHIQSLPLLKCSSSPLECPIPPPSHPQPAHPPRTQLLTPQCQGIWEGHCCAAGASCHFWQWPCSELRSATFCDATRRAALLECALRQCSLMKGLGHRSHKRDAIEGHSSPLMYLTRYEQFGTFEK